VNQPVITDVFKFVAIRPAQRVTEKDTSRTIIRDKRAATANGKVEIASTARRLSQSGAALAQGHEPDLTAIAPFADAYVELIRAYERVGPKDDPPDAKALLRDAGAGSVKDGNDPQLLNLAWAALYKAHASGNDAGPRLEAPMAALRIIHFAQTLAQKPRPTPAEAFELLRATVAIPEAFGEAFRPQPAAQSSAPQTAATPDDHARLDRVNALAAEIAAAERLLGAVTNAPASPTAAPPAAQHGKSAATFQISTTASLRQALPANLSTVESGIIARLHLADDLPAPAAAQTLQSHLIQLNDQALVLADDPAFKLALKKVSDHSLQAANVPPPTAPDVDVSKLIRPLGIGDLKVVKQTLLAYVAGEVAHIENVLQGELKERTHRNLDRTETTLFVSEEETKETERDTQSTDRFELKREAEQTVKEDMSVKAGLTVTATYGPIVATATGDFAYATSKTESQKNSSNFAREVVDRSVTKVQTKKRTERTTKTLNEVEEINRHLLDNAKAPTGNVTGVYRWVDKKYRGQVYNYGVRLLLEFIIPEPAAYYRASHTGAVPKIDAKPPAPFLKDPGIGRNYVATPLTADNINEYTYRRYAARYNAAGITPPPALFTYVGTALAPKDGLGEGISFSTAIKDLAIPAGYKLSSYSAVVSILWVNFPQFNLQVRGDTWEFLHNNGRGGVDIAKDAIGDVGGNNTYVAGLVPVSVTCYDVHSFSLNLQAVCIRTDEAFAVWQLDTFGKIQTAYQALQTAYDQKVTQAASAAGIPIEGQNPAINRIVEKTELKKLCITMMTGQHFKQFGAVTDQPELDVLEALAEGPIIQFFEQAFEWDQMTYLYYPYFWGRKKNWGVVTNQSDPDPLFQQFLTAGAARVLIPVFLAYVDDVQFLLQNPLNETQLAKKVWRGGDVPTLASPLYESIAEEMRNRTDDLAGATPEGDPWEFTLPTTLVWLQPDSTLPTFP